MFNSTYKRVMMLSASAVIASAFSLVSVAQAYAEPVVVTGERLIDPDLTTRIVKYGDLNIATQQGERLLLLRIGHAVHDVC